MTRNNAKSSQQNSLVLGALGPEQIQQHGVLLAVLLRQAHHRLGGAGQNGACENKKTVMN